MAYKVVGDVAYAEPQSPSKELPSLLGSAESSHTTPPPSVGVKEYEPGAADAIHGRPPHMLTWFSVGLYHRIGRLIFTMRSGTVVVSGCTSEVVHDDDKSIE